MEADVLVREEADDWLNADIGFLVFPEKEKFFKISIKLSMSYELNCPK